MSRYREVGISKKERKKERKKEIQLYLYKPQISMPAYYSIAILSLTKSTFTSCTWDCLSYLQQYRDADKTLARPGKKKPASVKSVMGRGVDWLG